MALALQTVVFSVLVPGLVATALGQAPEAYRERLEQLAAGDPAVAEALDELKAQRDANVYTQDEFLDNVQMTWAQFRTSADGRYILESGSSGRGALGAMIGANLSWTDKDTGEERTLAYYIRGVHADDKGLGFVLTMGDSSGKQTVEEHWFENLDPVTIVLAEFGEGDDAAREIVRISPEISRKQPVQSVSDHLPIRLSSAVLLVDDEYAGQFTAGGEIVGMTSGRAGLRIELAWRAFRDAQPIGICDGSTIQFEIGGRKCALVNAEPFVPTPGQWTVFVSWREAAGAGDGTHASSYAAAVITDALQAQPLAHP